MANKLIMVHYPDPAFNKIARTKATDITKYEC